MHGYDEVRNCIGVLLTVPCKVPWNYQRVADDKGWMTRGGEAVKGEMSSHQSHVVVYGSKSLRCKMKMTRDFYKSGSR